MNMCHIYSEVILQYCQLCDLYIDLRGRHIEKQQKKEKMKPKVRRHHTSKSDEPDQQESAFLKKIIAYQRKLLVPSVSALSNCKTLFANAPYTLYGQRDGEC